MISVGIAPRFHSDMALETRFTAGHSLAPTSGDANWFHDVCIFRLPDHLRRQWWSRAAQEMLAQTSPGQGLEDFLKAFHQLARFKEIPLLAEHKFKVLVRLPAQAYATGADMKANVALVNLGDEPTTVNLNDEPVLLEPGDGCWSPSVNLRLLPGDILLKADLDVLLQIQL